MPLAMLAFALRALWLDADPPANLTFSISPFTDEGFMVQNARSKLLFGSWLLDDFFRMAVSALFSLIEFANFWLFGPGFVEARLVSVLFGTGSVVLVFFLLRRERGTLAGFLGSSLLTTNYLFVMQNRLALEESAMLFFVLVSLWFLTARPARAAQFFFAGLAAAVAAFFLKLSGIFLLPALFAELLRQRFLVHDSPLKALGNRPLWLAALALGVGVLVWVSFVLVPFGHPAWLMVDQNTIHSQGGKPHGLLELVRQVFTLGTSDRLVMRAPAIFLFAGIGFVSLLAAFSKRLRDAESLEFSLALLLGSAVVLLSSTNYRPLRYQMTLLVPATLWAALVMERLVARGFERVSWSWRSALAVLPVTLIGSYALLHGLYSWIRSPGTPPSYGALLPQAVAFSALCLGVGTWLVRSGRAPWNISLGRVRGFVVAALLLGGAFDVVQYGRWALDRRYDLITLSRALRALPRGSVIAGPWASSATLETSHRALPMQEYLHADRPLERFPVTHVVIFEGAWEERYFRKTYPEVVAPSQLVASYPVAGKRLFLFAVPRRLQARLAGVRALEVRSQRADRRDAP